MLVVAFETQYTHYLLIFSREFKAPSFALIQHMKRLDASCDNLLLMVSDCWSG